MAEVDNKQVIFKGYTENVPKESDMELKVIKIKLEAPKGSGAFLVNNLYLSCDPYMRGRMRDFPFIPGQVDLLKNKLGIDEAFNYKEVPDFNAALKRYFPQGIDIYFDNVGGDMLDAALLNIRIHGWIAVCGVGLDYLHLYPRFLEGVITKSKKVKIVCIEGMNEGLDSAPAAAVGLFSGKKVGKNVGKNVDRLFCC